MKKTFFAVLAFWAALSSVQAGQLTLGTKLYTWTTNYYDPTTGLSVNGTEFFTPLTFNLNLDPGLAFYGQSSFGVGSYTPSINDPSAATDLSSPSDSLVGTELRFNNFGLPALLNVSVNIPTGDPTWENKEIAANVPTQFIDGRYHGRGLGVNAMYGIAFPSGSTELGAALGYSYAGSFNPGSLPNVPSGDLKLGDALFLSLSHVSSFSGNQKQIIRLSGYAFLPTQVNGANIYQQGINLNGSYGWMNPQGLSFEVGGQYYASAQRPDTTDPSVLATEANAYWAPRFYLAPSYAFGDLTVAGLFKYILPNNYALGDAFYEGGGFVAGLEPSFKMVLDGTSDIRLNAGYNLILHHNGGLDANLNYVEAYYNLFDFGATYEIRL